MTDCDRCSIAEECPFADDGGICPMDLDDVEWIDHRDEQEERTAAMRGVL